MKVDYRIDHYRARKVQNVPCHRFANGIFEPLMEQELYPPDEITQRKAWSGKEGSYYDSAGALRDLVAKPSSSDGGPYGYGTSNHHSSLMQSATKFLKVFQSFEPMRKLMYQDKL